MGVLVKHLKQLRDGRWQYRRVWPKDVKSAVPDLTNELKRTFSVGTSRDEAIRWTLERDRNADALIAKVRSGAVDVEREEVAHEAVSRWFHEHRDRLDEVVSSYWTEADDGQPIEVEETARDFEVERVLQEAAKRSGAAPDGSPRSFTLEEQLKLHALHSDAPPSIRMTINRAFDFYIERQLGGRKDKATEAARRQAIEYIGDIPLDRITRRMASDWTHDLESSRGQGAEAIRKRIGSMKAVINFARDQGRFDGENPFSRLQPPKQAKQTQERLPFHTRHLDAIQDYVMRARIKEETRDLVSLLLYTGCRPSEIGGLKLEDLSIDGPLPYLLVRWTPDRRLKTAQSKRRIPLLGLAFDAAVKASGRHDGGWLFPSVAPKSGEANNNPNLSARVNKVIRSAGVQKTPRLVTYSFRHTMAEALDRANVGQVIRDRVLGKQKADRYGANELPLELAKDALEAAIPLLGHVDEVEFTKEEFAIKPRELQKVKE